MEFWVDLVKTAWDCGIFERTLLKIFKVIPFQVTIPAALLQMSNLHAVRIVVPHPLDVFAVAMPPTGRIEAAERAERAAAGPSWSQGRGASDAVRLSTRFFITCG